MAKDLTKEGFSSEESKLEKKQLYKNWKLYAAALGIITIGLSVGLGVGLGQGGGDASVVAKKDLNDLGLNKTIDLSPNDTIWDVERLFDKFLQENSDIANDLKKDVNIKINDFHLPSWGTPGWVDFSGTGNYTGIVRVNFPAWEQTDLTTLNNKAITGIENMTQDDAFAAFLANNEGKDLSDLKTKAELKFTTPGYNKSGSLVIIAQSNTKYTGMIKVDISILKKQDINQLGLNTDAIAGSENMVKDDAFAAFLANNEGKDLSDLRANVNLVFVRPDYKKPGSLIITPTEQGKYNGNEIVIVIKPISDQKDLSSLEGLVLNFQGAFTNKDDAFAAFLQVNQERYPDLSDYVTIGSFKIGYMQNGSLVINGADDSKYIGSVKFSFSGLGSQLALDEIIDNNFAIAGSENMTQEMALEVVLDSIKDKYPDLRDNVEITNFSTPTYLNSGTLTIAARTDFDNKYRGNVTVVINQMPQQALSELSLNTNIEFSDNKWRTQDEIFEQFIKLNEDLYPDLRVNVEMGVVEKDDNQGTLEIKAKLGARYSGSVMSNFIAHVKTNLNDLHLQTSLINSEINTFYVDQEMAFKAFLSANSNIADLKDNVKVINFINSEYNGKHGSLTIAAIEDGKYTGEITIDLDSVTTPLNLGSFDGWNVGELELAEDSTGAITDAIMDKIDKLIKPTMNDGGNISLIKAALSISVDNSHTSITLKPTWLAFGKIIGQGTIYFTVKVVN